MNKERLRVEKAVTIVLEHLEYIIDHRTTSDFVEVTGRMGGNVVTYRIYNDGSIYERWEYLDTECREGIIKNLQKFRGRAKWDISKQELDEIIFKLRYPVAYRVYL